jgi:GNAT superfamily N-acetyltransferase
VKAEPIEGVLCVSIGFAVAESHRRQGLATRIIPHALEAFRVGLTRSGMTGLYIEAIVSTSNDASNKLARRFISKTFCPGVDSISGEPVFQYVALLK